MKRLAILTSHPIQYYAPLFRELAKTVDIHVFYAHRASAAQQANSGFGVDFDWDVDLLSGYAHSFLINRSKRPGTDHFGGCDTPGFEVHLRAGEFDALLITGWHLRTYLQGLLAAKRLGIPTFVRGDSQLSSPRSYGKRFAKSVAYPFALRRFDAALYVGQRSQEYFLHYGYPSERLFFSPHSIDVARFAANSPAESGLAQRHRLGIPADAKVVLFAGKLVPFKRPLDVIDAAAILRARGTNVHVLLAGSGELQGALIDRASNFAVPLHRVGFQNQTEMPSIYSASDVLTLPSSGRETWGLVCNESLACGRPIVVSDAVGCAPDLAGDGEVGRTFPVGDVTSLANALDDLLTLPPSRQSLAARSNAFGLRKSAEGIEDALHTTTDFRHRPKTHRT